MRSQTRCQLSSRITLVHGLVACLFILPHISGAAAAYPEHFVWISGWNLSQDSDVTDITHILDTASKHDINGAMIACDLDALSKHNANYFRRLDAIKAACDKDKLDLIPSVFSIGHADGILAHNPNLAEGLAVTNELFLVSGNDAHFVPDPTANILNGDFEDYSGNVFAAFTRCDAPGTNSFVDTNVKHAGDASIRLQDFANSHPAHARVMQTVHVTPQHCYRFSLWLKTESLRPTAAFKCVVLAHGHDLAPHPFKIHATGNWQPISLIFNSLDNTNVDIYAGVWGGRSGKVWMDDWNIEDAGPINVLHRPGTPVTVRNHDGSITYEEGTDYAPLSCPDFNVFRGDSQPAVLHLLPDSQIKNGERLRVSWYHPMVIEDSQVPVCMAEPELYEIFDQEAKLLEAHLHPHRVLLDMNEIRLGGTCEACAGKNLAELLGDCVTKASASIHKYSPDAQIYLWSDMFDPLDNAHPNDYLIRGDLADSLKYVPKDTVMVVAGKEPRKKSLRFFTNEGFMTLVSCYQDDKNLDTVNGWIDAAEPLDSVRGFMYTSWQKHYDLLPNFGDLLK